MQLALVEPLEKAVSPFQSTGSPRAGWWQRMKAEHLALALTVIAGFLVFTGQSYYDRLFRDFGLEPGILALSQAELVTKGVVCTLYAYYQLFEENLLLWLKSSAFGTGIAIIVGLIAWRSVRFFRLLEKGVPVIDWINRRWPSLLTWMFGLVFASTGLIAGDQGGALDASSMQTARQNPPNCYSVDGRLYRGVVLAQDQGRTILIQRSRTTILKNESLAFVAECPKR